MDCCSCCAAFPCTCTDNYWILSSGDNQLKGCCCDEENPIVLDDDFIIHALQKSPKAWKDFWVLFPSLFPCEKERFDHLFEGNPWLFKQVQSEQAFLDYSMAKWNKEGVMTVQSAGGQQKLNLPPTALKKGYKPCKPCM